MRREITTTVCDVCGEAEGATPFRVEGNRRRVRVGLSGEHDAPLVALLSGSSHSPQAPTPEAPEGPTPRRRRRTAAKATT